MSFAEYVQGLATVASGSAREKLQLSFDVFDIDNSGRISRNHLTEVLRSIYTIHEGSSSGHARVEDFVSVLFSQFDKDQTDTLSFVEYFQAAVKYPELTAFLKGSSPTSLLKQTVQNKKPAAKVSTTNARYTAEDVRSLAALMVEMAQETPPHHILSKEQFQRALEQHHVNWRRDAFLDRLFDVVLEEQGEKIREGDATTQGVDYRTYLAGLAGLCLGQSKKENCILCFDMYDLDGTGKLTKDEMTRAIIAFSGKREGVDKFIDGVFRRADKTKDGCLNMFEFVGAVMQNKELLEFRAEDEGGIAAKDIEVSL